MNLNPSSELRQHSFIDKPYLTVLSLSVPVLISLVAEPLTGLVDTAFVSRLGVDSLAGLGVGTVALSSIFWIFSFLGIGTQTAVAQSFGHGNMARATRTFGLALTMGAVITAVLIVLGWPSIGLLARLLGASDGVRDSAVTYMRIRLFGAPAILGLIVSFGALRGLQDMRTPLWIALGLNALNMILDAVLVLGYGFIPAMGIAGVAMASVVAQWLGAGCAAWVVYRRLGWPSHLRLDEARHFLRVGGDLFIRTGFLIFFLLLTTRVATQIGAESGAAHQVIRQVWVFAMLGLDALSVTSQSLVGYFFGATETALAKRVAAVTCIMGVGFGLLLSFLMIAGQGVINRLMVPASAAAYFSSAWLVAALIQPVNALAFITDGVHWGTGDFRYLRNAVFFATTIGFFGIISIDKQAANALTWVWIVTGVWVSMRAAFGLLRIWPGIGVSPLSDRYEGAAPGSNGVY